MNIRFKALSAVLLSIVVLNSYAGVSLFSARVGADDVEATAKFYIAALGMLEVNRTQIPAGTEIFLNFGETIEDAKANPAAQIAIMPRAPDSPKDPIGHLMLRVTDINSTLSAVKDAGGSVVFGPKAFGSTGVILAFVIDTAGNRIEMLQFPKP